MNKLLYITAFPPNHRSGGQTYSYNTIKDLGEKYIVDLIYFSYPNHTVEVGKYVNKIICYDIGKYNFLLHPLWFPIFSRRYKKQYKKQIQEMANDYDIIYFDYMQVGIYSLFIKHNYKVIRCHDIMYQKFNRENKLIGRWVKINEKKILKSATKIFVPSFKDQSLVKNVYNIDSEYTNEYIRNYDFSDVTNVSEDYIFFGAWSRKENMNGLKWFLDNVYPKLNEECKASLVIMGGGMKEDTIKKLEEGYGIKCLGYVENCYEVLAKSKALLVPLFEGAGIKVKVLDSFSTGTPVIGTSIAFEGIPDIEGLTIHAESAEEFVDQIQNIKKSNLTMKKKKKCEFYSMYNKRHISEFI